MQAERERTVLVVDDDAAARALVVTLLRPLHCRVVEAAGGTDALALLLSDGEMARALDLVVLDIMMPAVGGLEVLSRYRQAGGRASVVVCSAGGQVDVAVQAMRLGATDYVSKPFDHDEFRDVIQRALGANGVSGSGGEGTARSDSPAMRRVSEILARVAWADVPVLLTGESGVGKDVAAREIHARSPRAERVFVKINCAALPGELLESELFGHERGSFTGAARTKPGQFELANEGTLFLDEIGEMPVQLQAKLLQALQDSEFYRVGGQRRIHVDVRVIVATNRDLQRCIREGTFREDLYYRLNVVSVHIPPLRERREDIPALLHHFAEMYGARYGRAVPVPPDLLRRFVEYDWPGNIRQLENLVRRLAVLGDPALVLGELTTAPAPESPPTSPGNERPTAPPASPFGLPPWIAGLAGGTLDDGARWDLKEISRRAAAAAEREAILGMLARTTGNKHEAAERLGISYKAILYKIREFGIGKQRLRPGKAGAAGSESREWDPALQPASAGSSAAVVPLADDDAPPGSEASVVTADAAGARNR
jgi:two-component system response regulator AtoC